MVENTRIATGLTTHYPAEKLLIVCKFQNLKKKITYKKVNSRLYFRLYMDEPIFASWLYLC